MTCRVFAVMPLATSVFILSTICAEARAQVAPASMPTLPPHSCVKPEIPGRLASPNRISAFNKEYTAYGGCIKKYVEDTRSMATAAVAAANEAIDEFNKFSAELKAQNEAAKN